MVAHRNVDIACWLPSLHAEGGPPPEEVLPDAGPLSAVISGYFAERAGKPVAPTAPRVHVVQKQQLRTALPWAVRELELPALDGPAVELVCRHGAGGDLNRGSRIAADGRVAEMISQAVLHFAVPTTEH